MLECDVVPKLVRMTAGKIELHEKRREEEGEGEGRGGRRGGSGEKRVALGKPCRLGSHRALEAGNDLQTVVPSIPQATECRKSGPHS